MFVRNFYFYNKKSNAAFIYKYFFQVLAHKSSSIMKRSICKYINIKTNTLNSLLSNSHYMFMNFYAIIPLFAAANMDILVDQKYQLVLFLIFGL